MKKFVLASSLAVLLGAVSYSAWAQTAQNPPSPPPAEEQLDDDAGSQMAEDGWMGGGGQHGHRGKHRMHGRHMHGGQGEAGGMHGMRGMARMIDANGDNTVGDSEAAALADHSFQRLDRDASGELDEQEFTTVRKRGGWWNWSQAQNQGMSEGLKAKFTALDADKNSKVSKAEYMGDAQTRFTAADADKDGKVSAWEFYSQN